MAGVSLRRAMRPDVSGMETVTKQTVVTGQQLKYISQGDIVRQAAFPVAIQLVRTPRLGRDLGRIMAWGGWYHVLPTKTTALLCQCWRSHGPCPGKLDTKVSSVAGSFLHFLAGSYSVLCCHPGHRLPSLLYQLFTWQSLSSNKDSHHPGFELALTTS